MSSRCAAWSARVGKACRVVHATKAQQGLRRLLPTSSRTSCVDFILCLCNAAEQDTTGDGDQRRRQPRCDHGQSMWRSTSGPCRMVVSKKKKNKVKSNIQTEKKTMRCNKIIPKSLQSTCGSPPRRLDADSPARSDTKTTTAANSTSCGAKPRRKFGRLSDSRRYMYLFPTINGGQVSVRRSFFPTSQKSNEFAAPTTTPSQSRHIWKAGRGKKSRSFR